MRNWLLALLFFTSFIFVIGINGCDEVNKIVSNESVNLNISDLNQSLVGNKEPSPEINLSVCRPNGYSNVDKNEEIDRCLKNLAIKTNDSIICSEIKMVQWLRDECYNTIARQTKNLTLCELIDFDPTKEECLAIITLNSSFCKKIQDYYLEQYCLEEISNLKGDLNECLKGDTLQSIADCYETWAVNLNNHSICNYIEDIYLRDNCFSDVAKSLEDYPICKEILNFDLKESCFRKLAEKKKDANICEEIETVNKKNLCLAVVLMDKTICSRNESTRDYCYREVARAQKNIQICYEIKDDEERKSCFADFVCQEYADKGDIAGAPDYCFFWFE